MTRYYIQFEANDDTQSWKVYWGQFEEDGSESVDCYAVTTCWPEEYKQLYHHDTGSLGGTELFELRRYGYWDSCSRKSCCITQAEYEQLSAIEEPYNAYNSAWELLRHHIQHPMTKLDHAKAVADFMNGNPDAGLEYWTRFAAEHGLVPFDYSDDDWYRNDQYVVTRTGGKCDVVSLDRYDVERKTVWRALLKGEPVSDWVDSLGDALECAMNHVREVEKTEKVEDPGISFEKRSVIR